MHLAGFLAGAEQHLTRVWNRPVMDLGFEACPSSLSQGKVLGGPSLGGCFEFSALLLQSSVKLSR